MPYTPLFEKILDYIDDYLDLVDALEWLQEQEEMDEQL